MYIHLLNRAELVPQVGQSKTVIGNKWLILGVTSGKRPLAAKRIKELRSTGVHGVVMPKDVMDCSVESEHRKSYDYEVVPVDGAGRILVFGQYDAIPLDDRNNEISTSEFFPIKLVETESLMKTELEDLKSKSPFSKVYYKETLARVEWIRFSAMSLQEL